RAARAARGARAHAVRPRGRGHVARGRRARAAHRRGGAGRGRAARNGVIVPGTILDGRFVVEEPVAAGGGGVVWRGRGAAGGGRVALRVVRGGGAARFAVEARVLQELAHPGIVRHVAHGMSAAGDPWLALEWLGGETLAARLARGPLATAE